MAHAVGGDEAGAANQGNEVGADNDVKYNQPQGRVTMRLRRTNSTAELANTGPGIPSEVLPRVFDRFYRGDPAHSQTVDSCGFGLSIAQWIVSAHNGTMKIGSVPAELTTVTVRLPLDRVVKSA